MAVVRLTVSAPSMVKLPEISREDLLVFLFHNYGIFIVGSPMSLVVCSICSFFFIVVRTYEK